MHWYVYCVALVVSDVVEGVRICETDVNGVEHCRSLSDGINGEK